MATYDMTSKDTTGVSSNSIATLPSQTGMGVMRMVQAYLDIDALVAAGYSGADGDIFQLLEIPAGCLVLFAGAEVEKAFTGSCTLDMDFAAGDDIVDGGDITSTGYLAAGSNGQANIINTGAANTFTALIETADTIDVKIAATDTACVSGVLRLYAVCLDVSSQQTGRDIVDRDLLA